MMQEIVEPEELQPVHPGLEMMDDGFLMVDARWRITYWNPSAERLLGPDRRSAVGRELWSVLPSLRQSTAGAALRRARELRVQERCLDVHAAAPSGFLWLHAAPLPEGGLAVHFRGAPDQGSYAEQYARLLESIQQGFVAVDGSGRVVFLNRVAAALLRLRPDRVQNVSVWSVLEKGPEELVEALRSTKRNGTPRHIPDVRPPGRIFRNRVFDVWSYPISGGGISILFEDVTDRAERQDELARLAEEASAANEAKSRFFAAVSHELRTPLNAIAGYTHLLASGTYGELPPTAVRAATRACVCAEHLARLVDDLLLLTGAEVSDLSITAAPIDLAHFLTGMLQPYLDQAEAKGLYFQLDVPSDLPEVETDGPRLRQLLGALVANAVRYTDRGRIGLAVEHRGEVVEIAVTDTGPGIPTGDRERVFGPFEQVGDEARSNPLERGSGLGLALARKLASVLQGTLTLEHSSPEGSRFALRLPVRPLR
jgi:signal transduction histidine kinase